LLYCHLVFFPSPPFHNISWDMIWCSFSMAWWVNVPPHQDHNLFLSMRAEMFISLPSHFLLCSVFVWASHKQHFCLLIEWASKTSHCSRIPVNKGHVLPASQWWPMCAA
jgi:hypothetical protein